MAKFRPIIIEPSPILRKRSDEVKEVHSKEIQELIPDLILTMIKKEGIGIAAPQVGVNRRLCIINTADGPIALINPVITFKSKRTLSDEEGCLSIPGVWGEVERHAKIKIKAISAGGEKIAFAAEELFARIIQHEVDHLDGILFTDKATNIRKQKKDAKSRGA